ncbi:MAG: hypothetical protein P8J00_02370 [Yoonia sp.]|nr:hypothetical protein [Yoonia sp.]
MKFLLAILAVAIAGPVAANDIDKVSQTARNSFFQMPIVRVVDQITGMCGVDEGVSSRAAYCTSANEILLIDRPGAAYALAHVLGHAGRSGTVWLTWHCAPFAPAGPKRSRCAVMLSGRWIASRGSFSGGRDRAHIADRISGRRPVSRRSLGA